MLPSWYYSIRLFSSAPPPPSPPPPPPPPPTQVMKEARFPLTSSSLAVFHVRGGKFEKGGRRGKRGPTSAKRDSSEVIWTTERGKKKKKQERKKKKTTNQQQQSINPSVVITYKETKNSRLPFFGSRRWHGPGENMKRREVGRGRGKKNQEIGPQVQLFIPVQIFLKEKSE